jgi:hypothetical protein
LAKSQRHKDLEEVSPAHGVKSLGDVKLQEEARGLGRVTLPDEVLDVEEVIMDAPLLHKGALAFRDNVREI